MKKLTFLLPLLFLPLISSTSAAETPTIPECAEYTNYKEVYEGYLDVVLPAYMKPELTKSNQSLVKAFEKQAGSWMAKQVEGDFLGDGTTAIGSKVQLELNKISKRYPILDAIHTALNSEGEGVENIDYTAEGIKKFLLANDDFSKLFLCSSEISDNEKKKIQTTFEKTKRIMKNETDRIHSGKIPKTYLKAVNLFIWKQKILFQINNTENALRNNCIYESENEAYNCGG